MRSDDRISRLMNLDMIKNLGIREEAVVSIIDAYNDLVLDDLLENGHIELNTGMNIEVVRLIDRVHVLRGVSYKSSRKYKLKLTMEDKLYNRIEEFYNKLLEDIQ